MWQIERLIGSGAWETFPWPRGWDNGWTIMMYYFNDLLKLSALGLTSLTF